MVFYLNMVKILLIFLLVFNITSAHSAVVNADLDEIIQIGLIQNQEIKIYHHLHQHQQHQDQFNQKEKKIYKYQKKIK